MMAAEPYRDNVNGETEPSTLEIDSPNGEVVDQSFGKRSGCGNRRVYTIIGACSFLFIVGLVIGSGRSSSNQNTPATAPAPPAPAPEEKKSSELTEPVGLIPPPDDLAIICGNIDTKEKRDACEDACAPSECCDRPSHLSPHISCLKENHDACHTYHMNCIKLDEDYDAVTKDVLIPTPPHIITEFCTTESLEFHSAQAECQKICKPAECCYEDFDQINATCAHQDVCKDYALCHNLKAVKDKHHDISYLINEVCTTSHDMHDMEKCKQSCLPANCCFNPHVKCLGEEEHGPAYCEQYEGCKTIFHDELLHNHTAFDEFNGICAAPKYHKPNPFMDHHDRIPINPTDQCKEICKERYDCCRSQDPSTCEHDCHTLAGCHHVHELPPHIPHIPAPDVPHIPPPDDEDTNDSPDDEDTNDSPDDEKDDNDSPKDNPKDNVDGEP